MERTDGPAEFHFVPGSGAPERLRRALDSGTALTVAPCRREDPYRVFDGQFGASPPPFVDDY